MRIACILFSCLLCAQPPSAPKPPVPITGKAVVAGVVVDSVTGEPVRGVQVQVYSASGRRSQFTGPDGAFRFEQLGPGQFSITAQRANYGVGRYADVRLGDEEKREGIRVKLAPNARISGVVVDEYDEPVSGCLVSPLTRSFMSGERWQGFVSAGTDEDGEYSLSISEGSYRLRLECSRPVAMRIPFGPDSGLAQQGLVYRPMFYPEAQGVSTSEVLRLGAGESRERVNFRVRAVPAAAISIANPVSGVNLRIEAAGTDDLVEYTIRGMGPKGYVGMFPAGQYSLTALSMSGGQMKVMARGSVVMDGREPKSVTLEPYTPREVNVQVMWDGEAPREYMVAPDGRRPFTFLTEGSGTGYRPFASTPDGALRWTLNPGKVRFVPQGLPMWVVLTKIRMGRMSVEGDTATFLGDEEGDLEITLSARAGTVQVNPVWSDAEAQKAANGLFRGLVVDASGRIDMRRVVNAADRLPLRLPPGRHEIYLFSSWWADHPPDLDALRAARFGAEVIIEEGKTINVDVRVIGEKEVAEAERTTSRQPR